jgi:AcrR family transcriptional regulator
MARRQARFTLQELEGNPRLSDDSSELWDDELAEVPRRLLTSAVRCFASNGYHATTTRDITATVGLSPAALYVHFESKEHVLFAIMLAGHVAALEYIQGPLVEAASDTAQRLRLTVSRYTEWHARHHVTAKVCQNELANLSPAHYEEILELRHQTNKVFRDVVSSGVKDGTFEAVDVNRIVRAMLSLSIDLTRWYRLDGADSPDQMGALYGDLVLTMVLNAPERWRSAALTAIEST